MYERLPSVFFTIVPVRAVHVVPVSTAVFSQTRVVPTIMWLQRVPHSALPLPRGLPLNRSNGSAKDCVSARIVALRRSPPKTAPVPEQFVVQRCSAPLLLLA